MFASVSTEYTFMYILQVYHAKVSNKIYQETSCGIDCSHSLALFTLFDFRFLSFIFLLPLLLLDRNILKW